MDGTFWKDAITISVALLGAVLGIMNTWRAMNQSKIRLRVKPAHAVSSAGGRLFSIEVVNLGNFAVTIREVGFTVDGRTIRGQRRAVPRPILMDGGDWPRRLEARDSVSTYFDPHELIGSGLKLGRAYARTACGEVRYGTSPAAKQLREAAA